MTDTHRVKAIIFDVDGTLALRDRSGGYVALPGAVETLADARRRNIPHLVYTNGTGRTSKDQAAALGRVGIEIDYRQYITPSHVAADYFLEHGLQRVLGIGVPASMQPLRDIGLEVLLPEDSPASADAVYVASITQFNEHDMECIARAIARGANLFVSTDVPYFAAQGAPAINFAAAVCAAVTCVTGRKATVLGKPAPESMAFAARRLGVAMNELAIVGDDPRLEIQMARNHGAYSVGVTTGICDRVGFESGPKEQQPHLLLGSMTSLLDKLPI